MLWHTHMQSRTTAKLSFIRVIFSMAVLSAWRHKRLISGHGEHDMSDEPIIINYYGIFDAQGVPQGFWASDIWPPQSNGDLNAAIPVGAMEITYDQWQQLLNNQPFSRFIDGAVVILDPPPPPPQPPNPLDEIMATLTSLSERISKLEK